MKESLISVEAKFNGEIAESSLGIDCGHRRSDSTLGTDFVLVLVDTVEVNEFDLLDDGCLAWETTSELFPAEISTLKTTYANDLLIT